VSEELAWAHLERRALALPEPPEASGRAPKAETPPRAGGDEPASTWERREPLRGLGEVSDALPDLPRLGVRRVDSTAEIYADSSIDTKDVVEAANAQEGLHVTPPHQLNEPLAIVQGMKIIAYMRVSTHEQAKTGLGIEAQRTALNKYASFKGYEIIEEVEDVVSTQKETRESLQKALQRVLQGDADCLAVAKLDRLARSVVEVLQMSEKLSAKGKRLIALDLDIDTNTPNGEFMLTMLAAISRWERRVIGERTKVALAEAKDKGVVLGAPPTLSKATKDRVILERWQNKRTLQGVADALNQAGIPPAKAKIWTSSNVRETLKRCHALNGPPTH
jgi:DNA invertase Pin-like site-specific DNA recombinase